MLISNIIMENVLACITVNSYYSCVCGEYPLPPEVLFDKNARPVDENTPTISNVRISGILARGVKGVGIYCYGLPEAPVSDLQISDVQMEIEGSEKGIGAVMAPDRVLSYGEGIFLENAEQIDMHNVQISCPGEKIILKNSHAITYNGQSMA